MVVLLVFFVGQCPAFAAGLIMAASDHQVLCSFDSHEIKIVFVHHPQVAHHKHTFAERLVLSSSGEDGHPDHQFRFVREAAMTAADETALLPPTAVSVWVCFAGLLSDSRLRVALVSAQVSCPLTSLGANAHVALLQCVVMQR